MSPEETRSLRLECLRLAHNPDATPCEGVQRAKAYEDYYTGADRAALADEATAVLSPEEQVRLQMFIVSYQAEPDIDKALRVADRMARAFLGGDR